jgi:accessory gene regulator protein AgrB
MVLVKTVHGQHSSKFVVCVVLSVIRIVLLLIVLFYVLFVVGGGTAVAQWLRYSATNRKVAGSIPDGVIGIFH